MVSCLFRYEAAPEEMQQLAAVACLCCGAVPQRVGTHVTGTFRINDVWWGKQQIYQRISRMASKPAWPDPD